MLTVLRNQKPDQIMIHCDCDNISGDYFQRVLKIAHKTKTVITVRKIERLTQIFGKPLSRKWLNYHSSDISRIKSLIEFGGIYLDRDVYVVKSLDIFRKYEMTLECNDEEYQYVGNQVLIAHKNARFLKLWLDSYHDYHINEWYYNGGMLPTLMLKENPQYIHRVKKQFGSDGPTTCPNIYSIYYPKWREDYYAIHLVIRGDEISVKGWCFGNDESKYPKVMKFNESNVKDLNVTFGEMTRLLFEFEKSFED